MAGLFEIRAFAADVLQVAGSPSWTRLEPQSIGGDPAEALAAELYDPLWLLGRQWQLGELTGEDCGTPLVVELAATASRLRAFSGGDWTAEPAPPWEELTSAVPLEELTEAEPGRPTPGLRPAAAAGAALVTALRDVGLGAAADVLLERCPLPPPADDVDAGFSAVARVLAGRGVDGASAAAALAGDPLPDWLSAAVPAARRAGLDGVVRSWLAWYGREVAPAAAGASWTGRRLEHRFRVSDGTVVLAAPEHGGLEVGWSTFDHLPGAVPPDLPPEEPVVLRQRVLASPLRFPGMPASRFWELEDAQVDLGAVEADPHDLARLLVVECALVFGGDWLVVPFDVPAGSVVRTSAVTCRTTFGETFLVGTTGTSTSPSWRLFDVTTPDGAGLGALVVPPTPPGRLEGPPLEQVSFLRDELANLVWAVEHVVEGPSGDAVPVAPGVAAPAPAGEDGVLRYVLATDVPDSWVPYLPTTSGYATVDLVRGALRRDAGPARGPRGALLAGDDLSRIAAAEVPRDGVRVTRVPVVARLADGTVRTWVSRRAGTGRGEGRSGLAFDGAV